MFLIRGEENEDHTNCPGPAAGTERTGIQYHIVDNYYKNKVVRYDSYILLRICTVLDCGIEELIEISDEGEK